jgi:hypothetical protein
MRAFVCQAEAGPQLTFDPAGSDRMSTHPAHNCSQHARHVSWSYLRCGGRRPGLVGLRAAALPKAQADFLVPQLRLHRLGDALLLAPQALAPHIPAGRVCSGGISADIPGLSVAPQGDQHMAASWLACQQMCSKARSALFANACECNDCWSLSGQGIRCCRAFEGVAGLPHPIFSIIREATPLVCVSNSPTPSFTTATRFFSATTFCLDSRLRRSASCFTLRGVSGITV